MMSSKVEVLIDPTCLMHGQKMSEHDCLFCCLCFKSLTIEECHIIDDDQGLREDVCEECAEEEKRVIISRGGNLGTNSES